MGHSRRRSVDSSSSSSSSSSDSDAENHHKKDKKDKKKHGKVEGHLKDMPASAHSPANIGDHYGAPISMSGGSSGHGSPFAMPEAHHGGAAFAMPDAHTKPGVPPPFAMPHPSEHPSAQRSPQDTSAPPAYAPPPPSGYRVPLTTAAPFPTTAQTRDAPFRDADGSPVFLGSAIFPNAVHPCKIAPRLQPPCRVPYGGTEHGHEGRYDLLPFVPETMEWVRTGGGRVPKGRRPVEGGYEDHGAKLYHAVAEIGGVRVPGKTGEHLVGLFFSSGHV
ncbi:hypothetical protein OF83DRAFT_1166752 [Amylostereum chailletii]|nr:hypothetical protein OF83DRAFT_1166752 [Amylostereum chailletii]